MKKNIFVFAFVFASLSFSPELPAAELNAIKAADIAVLAADLKAAPPPALADFFPQGGPDPVVITVPGLRFADIGPGGFELGNIFALINHFFPKKQITERALLPAYDSAMRKYFQLRADETLPPARKATRVPDNYLEEKLKDLPGYAEHNLEIAPFRWSRDPDNTDEVLPELVQRIIEVSDSYKGTGRPVYILAHSWGSVLSHTALHRVAKTRPDVKIARWITLGSPLMPGNAALEIFMKMSIEKEELEKAVTKPGNVTQWRNIWAQRDILSNAIKPADVNIQIDTPILEVETQVLGLIKINPQNKVARKDLLSLRNPGDWHGAYFYDYKAYLNSLQKELFVPVFLPVLAPQITDATLK